MDSIFLPKDLFCPSCAKYTEIDSRQWKVDSVLLINMTTPPGPLAVKSYACALRSAQICMAIQKKHHEYVLTKQFLRSSGSIGANIEEASQTQSKRDFVSKLSISLKEAHEARYWLRLLCDLQLCSETEGTELQNDIQEIIRMLVSSIKTTKSRI